MKTLLLFTINIIWATAVLSKNNVHPKLRAKEINSQNAHDVSKESESDEINDFLKNIKHNFEQNNIKVHKLKSNDEGKGIRKPTKRYKVVISYRRKLTNDSAITDSSKTHRVIIKEKHNNKNDSLADSKYLLKQANNHDNSVRLEETEESTATPLKWESRRKFEPLKWQSRRTIIYNGESDKEMNRNRSLSTNGLKQVSSSIKRKKFRRLEPSEKKVLLNSEKNDYIYEKEGLRSKLKLNNGYNVVQNEQKLGSNERKWILNANQHTNHSENHSRRNLYAKKSSTTTSDSWEYENENNIQNILKHAKLGPHVELNPSSYEKDDSKSRPFNWEVRKETKLIPPNLYSNNKNYDYLNELSGNSPNEWKVQKKYGVVPIPSKQYRGGLNDKETTYINLRNPYYDSQNIDENSTPSFKDRENFETSRKIANDWYGIKQFEQRYPITQNLRLNKQQKLVPDLEKKSIEWKLSKQLKLIPNRQHDNANNNFGDITRNYYMEKPVNNFDLTEEDVSDQNELKDEEKSSPVGIVTLQRTQSIPWFEKNRRKSVHLKSNKLKPNLEEITNNRTQDEYDNFKLNRRRLDSGNEEDNNISDHNIDLNRNNKTLTTKQLPQPNLETKEVVSNKNDNSNEERNKPLTVIGLKNNENTTPLIVISSETAVNRDGDKVSYGSVGANDKDIEDKDQENDSNEKSDKKNVSNETVFKNKLTQYSLSNKESPKELNTLTSEETPAAPEKCKQIDFDFDTLVNELSLNRPEFVNDIKKLYDLLLKVARQISRSPFRNLVKKVLRKIISVLDQEKITENTFSNADKNGPETVVESTEPYVSAKEISAMPDNVTLASEYQEPGSDDNYYLNSLDLPIRQSTQNPDTNPELMNNLLEGKETLHGDESSNENLKEPKVVKQVNGTSEKLNESLGQQIGKESPEPKSDNLEVTNPEKLDETLEEEEKNQKPRQLHYSPEYKHNLKEIKKLKSINPENSLGKVIKDTPKLFRHDLQEYGENFGTINPEQYSYVEMMDTQKNNENPQDLYVPKSIQNSKSVETPNLKNLEQPVVLSTSPELEQNSHKESSHEKPVNTGPQNDKLSILGDLPAKQDLEDVILIVLDELNDKNNVFFQKSQQNPKSNEGQNLKKPVVLSNSPESVQNSHKVSSHEKPVNAKQQNDKSPLLGDLPAKLDLEKDVIQNVLDKLNIKNNVYFQKSQQNSESNEGQKSLKSRENSEVAGQNKDLPILKLVQPLGVEDKYKNTVNPERIKNSQKADQHLENPVIAGQKSDKSPLYDGLHESSIKIESVVISEPKIQKAVQNSQEKHSESDEAPLSENLKETVPESKQKFDNYENENLVYYDDANPENLEKSKVTKKANLNPQVDNFLQAETKLDNNETLNPENLKDPDAAEKNNINQKSDKVTNFETLEESNNFKELVPSENVAVSSPEDVALKSDMLNFFYELENYLEKVPDPENQVNVKLADNKIETQTVIFDELQSNKDLPNNTDGQIDLKHVDYDLVQKKLLGIFKQICDCLREGHVPERLVKEIANKILVMTLHKIEEKTVHCKEKEKFDNFVNNLKGNINNYLVETTITDGQNFGKDELRGILRSAEMKQILGKLVEPKLLMIQEVDYYD